jgi:hypothetical protein
MNEEQGSEDEEEDADGEEHNVMDVDDNSEVREDADVEDVALSGEAMFSEIRDMKARGEPVKKRNVELQKCKTCAKLLSTDSPHD